MIDEGTVQDIDEIQKIQEPTTDVVTKPEAPAIEIEDQDDTKKLYPITQAVKEWMSKTREATPEVEILKSPTTIQREFGGNGDDLNDVLDSDEDEVTLFTTDDTLSQEQPDLLEYWENDVAPLKNYDKSEELVGTNRSKVCSEGSGCSKCQNTKVTDGKEEIEVYESKYGQNDAFLNLHRELKQQEQNASLPDHLPYRTVCCSLQ